MIISQISAAFYNTKLLIKENKFFFSALLLIQLVFMLVFLAVLSSFVVQIMDNANQITAQVETVGVNSETGEISLNDASGIYEGYNLLKDSLIQMTNWLIFLYLLFQGGLWVGTHKLINNKSGILKPWIKQALSSVLFWGIFFIISYYYLKYKLLLGSESLYLLGIKMSLALIVLHFFLGISFGLININSWKTFLSKFFNLSCKKIGQTLPVFLTLVLGIILNIYLIYITREILILSILFIISLNLLLILCRIFWINYLQKINDLNTN
ncbi:MAG TPA: hypothetical protein VJC39_05590 [Candidatus Nanoarchaeia archaeon]|nr:hypothetical protein [Candidatus Nanoarchaeia archaeon]